MIKKINSSTGNFEDQVTDTIVLDTVPTVNSFNAVTSDGVARAVAGASGEVPQVTENDNGKVLTAIYDAGGPAVEWQEAQGGGTSYTAGAGIEISNDEIKAKVASGTALHVGNVPVATGSIATKDMAMTVTTNSFPVTTDEGITLTSGYYTAKVVVTDGNGNTATSVNACTPFYWNTIFPSQSVPISATFDLTEGWEYSEGFDQSIMDHYNAYAFIAYDGNGDRVGITGLSGSTSVLSVQEYSKEVALYSEIPAATPTDGQKFLMAHPNTAPTYETVRQVPAYGYADTNKVLTVSTLGPAWQRAGVPKPNPAASDDGKVLRVNGTEYGWYENSPAVPDDSLLTLEHKILDRDKDFALSSLSYFKQLSPMSELPYWDLVDGREYTVRFVLQKDGESAMAVSVPTLQFTYPGFGSSLMWGTIDVQVYGWTYIDSSASDWNHIHYGGCAPKFQLTDSVTGDVYYTGTDWTIEAYYRKDGKLRINALPGNNNGDILRWNSDVRGYVPQGFELPYQYMECHKFWGGEYATYTSNDVTIAPDFSQDEDWNGYIDFAGYAHCREVQMYGKFEGNGTTAATNNVSTTVTIVIENRFDNTDTYTLALDAKQFAKNYVVDPQGSRIRRYSIMFCTEDFQIPFDCNARKSAAGSDYFLKSIHVDFAGLTAGGTALGPDSTSIAFRTTTFPYWE